MKFVIAVALAGLAMLAFSGLGVRAGLWDYRFGLTLLRYSAYVGIASMVLAVVALLLTRPKGGAIFVLLGALAIGLVTFALPWSFSRTVRNVPPIHDISTDTETPPAFVAVLPLRANASNSAEYAGDSIASLQRAAYPDVQPIMLSESPGAAFARALAAASDMGWEIVAADSTEGRIEATATTTWFGFKDDVVIRVRAEGSGSRVDVRSVSRVGRSDVGANAARIRAYAAKLASR